MKALAVNLISKEKIKTVEARAKELRPFIEKLITKAKKGGLHMRRQVIPVVGVKPTKKLFEIIAPKYTDRKGGYTRITKIPHRVSDASRMAIIELI